MNYKEREKFEELLSILFTMKSQAEKLESMAREETDRDFKVRIFAMHDIVDQAYVQSIKALLHIWQF